MPPKLVKTFLLLLVIAVGLSGCYYTQAARGQWELMRKREPIAEVINDPDTPQELRRRLQLVQEARDFSVRELKLPDNKSYRSYADLERDYVLWNIFAAEEFSVTPKTWCYPIVGCLSYRGYFKKDKAESIARELREDGYDVFLGGVPAYSTLGNFSDPVLNTMMRWDDIRLVATLFHELAHQVLYIKDDTGFNESFATAVEEFGIERFLDARGESDDFATYQAQKSFREALVKLVVDARADLRVLYESDLDANGMREQKTARIDELTGDLRILLEEHGFDANAWLSQPFNNARLASFALYEGRVPAFRAMLASCDDDLECFYAEAKRVSRLDAAERDAYLDALQERH